MKMFNVCMMIVVVAFLLVATPCAVLSQGSPGHGNFQRHGYSVFFNIEQSLEKEDFLMDPNSFLNLFRDELGMSDGDELVFKSAYKDELGYEHLRYAQVFHGIPVHGAGLVLHMREGIIKRANGRFYPGLRATANPVLKATDALQLASGLLAGNVHLHGDVELLIASPMGNDDPANFRLCYRVALHSDEVFEQGIFFMDALSGELVKKLRTMCQSDETGIAHTLYSGIQNIQTEKTGNVYRLRETERPIHTRNLNNTLNLNFTTEFLDNDNIWDEKVRTLRHIQLNNLGAWWQMSGQAKPSIYFIIRDAANQVVARTMTMRDSLPPFKVPVQIVLNNPPYNVSIWNDTIGGASLIWGGQYNLQANPGMPSFNFLGNSGHSTIVQQNNPALDAHWCIEETYDFFMNEFGRNSYDNAGGQTRAYIHFGLSWPNAAWGTLDNRMFLGDGDGVSTNYRTYLNVVAHEFTHGVIYHNGGGGLDYEGESGALNESFADIFGTAAEFYIKPQSANWLHGEEGALNPGDYVRSFIDPHSRNQPHTYGFNDPYWHDPTDPFNDGGIHINSGVQNHWYYLLVEGGTAINANGDSYSVEGIGLAKALQIVYRNLTTYLTATTIPMFVDAWQGSLMSVADLYGPDSDEYKSVQNAWYAVGLGEAVEQEPWCSGLVLLEDQAGSLEDGSGDEVYVKNSDCSWLILPEKADRIMLAFSSFDLDTQSDTLFLYDGVDAQAPLLAAVTGDVVPDTVHSTDGALFMHFTSKDGSPGLGWEADYTSHSYDWCAGHALITTTEGTLEDGSGDDRYGNHTVCTWLIQPAMADYISIHFQQFATEADKDWLYVYDGEDDTVPLLGAFAGHLLPGDIVTSGGAVFLKFETDALGRDHGWQLHFEAGVNTSILLEEASIGWQVFPNPGEGQFNLLFDQPLSTEVRILVADVLGRALWEQTLAAGTSRSTLELGGLPIGPYFLQLDARGHVTRRMLIKH
jgi:Zn-dependent metalloprotease